LVDAAGPSFIYTANRLLLFPHALTSLALATATFPLFARLGAARDYLGLRQAVDTAARQTLFVAIPAAIGMMLVAQTLIELMFEGEKTTAADLVTANLTTICLVASLPSIGVAQLHARALYALGDYRTPALMSFWLLLLNLILNVVFVVGLGLGVPGLALATSLASMVNALGLRRALALRCPSPTPGSLGIAPTMVASGLMGLMVFAAQSAITSSTKTEQAVYDLGLPILAGVVTYGALRFRALRQRSG
jgi:putative peptidoglycan lipid II flippase